MLTAAEKTAGRTEGVQENPTTTNTGNWRRFGPSRTPRETTEAKIPTAEIEFEFTKLCHFDSQVAFKLQL